MTKANAAGYTVLETIPVMDPAKAAQKFSLMLAHEKGYSSTIVRTSRGVVDVVASDNRAIRFAKAMPMAA